MRVAIVTGSNQGIGFETVKGLIKSGTFTDVYLTGRNAESGAKAVKTIVEDSAIDTDKTKLHFQRLDLNDSSTMDAFLTLLDKKHAGGFDVLVQNAAIAFAQGATESFDVQAKVTFDTNVFGTLTLMKKFAPRCRENGRIVLVSSLASQIAIAKFKPSIFTNPMGGELSLMNSNLTLERMEELATQFVNDCKNGTNEEKGWPDTAYGLSKVFTNCMTSIYSKKATEEGKGVLVNCCCPGFVKTNLSSFSERAPKLPHQGAIKPIYLALLPTGLKQPQGSFVCDA